MARTLYPSAVLNRTQLEFLEQIIARCGTVVTYEQISPHIPVQDELGKRQFVSRLSQAGWLVRIKKGVYQVADLASLGTVTLSRYAVAHILASDSYVSFDFALQYHGLYDQLTHIATSVALKQRPSVVVQEITYQFVKTTPTFFFGYDQHYFAGRVAQIATAEKALIDMIQLHRSYYSADRVAEILAGSAHMLEMRRLKDYLGRANLTTQRIFGFWFDRLGMAFDPDLAQRARSGQAASRLTPGSTTYDPKWRLYYDTSIVDRYVPA